MRETSPPPRGDLPLCRERYPTHSFTLPDGREVSGLSDRELRILTALAGGEARSSSALAEIFDPGLFAKQPYRAHLQVHPYISSLRRKLGLIGMGIKNEVPRSERREARYHLQELGGEGKGEVVIFEEGEEQLPEWLKNYLGRNPREFYKASHIMAATGRALSGFTSEKIRIKVGEVAGKYIEQGPTGRRKTHFPRKAFIEACLAIGQPASKRSLAIREPEKKLRPFVLTRKQVVALGVVLGLVGIRNGCNLKRFNISMERADLRALHKAVLDSTGKRPHGNVGDFRKAKTVLRTFPENREAFLAQNDEEARVVLGYLERFPDGESLEDFLSFLLTEYKRIKKRKLKANPYVSLSFNKNLTTKT